MVGAGRPPGGVGGRHAGLVLARVREHRDAGHVARGPDAVAGAHAARRPRCRASRSRRRAPRSRSPRRRRAGRSRRSAARPRRVVPPSRCTSMPGSTRSMFAAQVDVDALAGEHVARAARPASGWSRGSRRSAMSASATFAPIRRKNWASSQPTAPAPRMTMLSGISRHGRRLAVRPVVDLVQTGDGRDRRHRAGRDHEPLVAELAARRLDDARARDDRASPRTSSTSRSASHSSCDESSPAARHLVAVPEDARGVELSRHGLGGAGCKPRGGERLGGAQQRLGRHARVVGALAADELALDERDPGVGLEAAQRAGEGLAGRAAADDEDVAGHRSTVCPPPPRVTPVKNGV